MAKKTYVGVNNVARNVSKMYVGVNGVARKVKKAYVGVNGVAKQVYEAPLKIVTFNGGTDQEIYDMLEAHYKGVIDVSNYWSVGDSRTIHLSAMEATYVGESHRAQDMIIEIVDFKHDTLWTPIRNITKAAVTISCKNALRDATVSDTDGANNTERGYMKPTQTYVGGWSRSERRNWCNRTFYDALPHYIKNGVKQVKKDNYIWDASSSTSMTYVGTGDYCFLGSIYEYLGSSYASGAFQKEGTRYARYNTTANLAKLPRQSSSYPTFPYFTRTSYKDAASDIYNKITGVISYDLTNDVWYGNSTTSISPMFCM